MMSIYCVLCTFIFCLYNVSYSQTAQLTFQHVTVRDGLSSSAINDIIQDQKGFLWFGTENGLNRYDGINFQIYRHDPNDTASLSHNYIWSLAEDHTGYIWVGTDGGGLNRFHPATEEFTRYTFDHEDTTSISGDIVQYIFVDTYNDVWIGTWGNGLNKFNRETETFTRFIHDDDDPYSISNNKIFCIYEDSYGNLWIGTDGGGASILNRETMTFQHFRHDPGNNQTIASDYILRIFEDSRGVLWFGLYSDVLSTYDYATNKFHHYTNTTSSFTGSIAWNIIEDSAGYIWIGTLTGGIYLFDHQSGSFTHLAHDPYNLEGINTNYIRSLFEDASGVLWIGTVMNGLNRVDRKPQKFHTITKKLHDTNSLPDNTVSAILEDRDGHIWFGTLTSGLSKFNPWVGLFTHYASEPENPDALNGDIIKTIYESTDGTIWVGTYFSVLNSYDKSLMTFTHHDLESLTGYPSGVNNIRIIHEDNDGILWFGVHGGGIIRYDKTQNSFMRFSTEDTTETTISSDYILALIEDHDNNLWIGTHGGGLNKFNKHDYSFESFVFNTSDEASISDNMITDLFIDSKGILWIGTYSGGLNRFNRDNNTFTRFREIDGLASDLVCSIVEDDEDFLWLSTGRGISKFDTTTFTFRNYDHSDGIRMDECNPGSRTKTKNGWIYFGGISGVTYFHPDNIYDNPFKPPVVITSIKINHFEYSELNPAYTKSIILSPKDNSLSVEFASLDYTLPVNNQYAVFLEGLDIEWSYIGNRRYMNYTNLTPGNYRLYIKGSNNNGIWNENPVSLAIVVQPPFWVTTWFRLIIIIVIGGLLYYSRVTTLRKERRAQEEISKHLIESQEKERKRIAGELHDSLGQNLLIIKNRALLGLENPDINTLLEQMNDISELTSHTINEVREISYNLRPYQLDRLGLKEAVDSIIARIDQTTSIDCSVSIDALNRTFPKETDINLYRIVQELLNNIVKHSNASSLSVIAVYSAGELTLTVSDNGSGFEPEIFKSDSGNGQGFGLIGMQERVKILKGTFAIHSSPETGTTVTIIIPVKDDKHA